MRYCNAYVLGSSKQSDVVLLPEPGFDQFCVTVLLLLSSFQRVTPVSFVRPLLSTLSSCYTQRSSARVNPRMDLCSTSSGMQAKQSCVK